MNRPKLSVLTSVSYDCEILPHFLEHYLLLGVDRFVISVHEIVPGIWQKTEETAQPYRDRIEIQLVPVSERQARTGVEGPNKEETRRRCVTADEWIIPADLDELIAYPQSPRELIGQLSSQGHRYAWGYFSDRITRDGSLVRSSSSPSLWEQYPIECQVTRLLVQGCCHKITLCRGDCELTTGHHWIVGLKTLPRSCVVHHFKWRQGIVEALRRRCAIYKQAGVSWHVESERVLAYLDKHEGCLVPEHFEAKEGWKPDGAPIP